MEIPSITLDAASHHHPVSPAVLQTRSVKIRIACEAASASTAAAASSTGE